MKKSHDDGLTAFLLLEVIVTMGNVKKIYKRIPPDTPISTFSPNAMPQFLIELRDNPKLNDVSMGTYARDLKTLMRFL